MTVGRNKLLSTAEEISELARNLRSEKIISFDTEFIRETTFYPIVEIIQIATRTQSWIVDAQSFKRNFRPGPRGGFDPAIQPLLDVFADKDILKIVHAAQGDEECIYTSFGSIVTPILDTAVAASFCGLGDGVGLGKLLKSVMSVEIKKGHARTNWSVRPLPAQLIEYAHADVEHLVELGERLMEKLDEIGRRQWALDASAKWEDKALYDPDPKSLALKLARGGRLDRKGQAVLVELVKWREERVRQLNLPRRWVADDAVVLDLANVRPKDIEHLSAFRGLNKGELQKSGEAILSGIQRGIQAAEDGESSLNIPRTRRPDIPSIPETQVMDLLKCYVGILADKHRLAAKHLLTSAQLLPLLRSEAKTADDLVAEGLLTTEAARIVGEELLEFLRGKRALSVVQNEEGAQIQVVQI